MARFGQSVWIALLAYVFLGGLAARLGALLFGYGPYCYEPPDVPEGFLACEPCSIRWSVFGVLETTQCENSIVKWGLAWSIGAPHTFVVSVSLLVYGLVSIHYWAATAVIVVSLSVLAALVVRRDIVTTPRPFKAAHRLLLLGILSLASWHALVTTYAYRRARSS